MKICKSFFGKVIFLVTLITIALFFLGYIQQLMNARKPSVETETMTLEEKVGQLFLARCPSNNQIETIKDLQPGGYVLFSVDFENKTPQQVTDMIASYQNASKIPMVVAVDEEGGTVVRVSKHSLLAEQPYKSPQEIYTNGGMNAIISDSKSKSNYLKQLGINLNLAPVADVSTDPKDFIFKRSFGKSADETASYVESVIKSSSISSCLKHFPGYGNNVDTHTGMSIDKRPIETFESSDFKPFISGINAGAEFVLVSHNIVETIDPSLPASLSLKMNQKLRVGLDFDGIIITDDLSMDAIKDFTDGKNPCVKAIQAGNDMLIVTDFKQSYNEVLQAAKSGIISEERINESIERILKWKKLRLGYLVG